MLQLDRPVTTTEKGKYSPETTKCFAREKQVAIDYGFNSDKKSQTCLFHQRTTILLYKEDKCIAIYLVCFHLVWRASGVCTN